MRHTRAGASSELVFSSVSVYVIGSPIFLSASPVLAKVSDGWNRFTLCVASAVRTLGKPTGEQVTWAVLTNGSGAPGGTVNGRVST